MNPFFFLFFLFVATVLYPNVRIGIVTNPKFYGERELACRIKIAAEALGWEVVLDERKGKRLSKEKDLDWVISLVPEMNFFHKDCLNYLFVSHGSECFDSSRKLLEPFKKYDGYLAVVDPSSFFVGADREMSAIAFYPTVQPVPYQRIKPRELVTFLPAWGNRSQDPKFQMLYEFLSQSGAKFYGPITGGITIPKGYMGMIPFDGVSAIRVLQKHGICLVLHSDLHIQQQIPSSRIFEAAAASAVIIADQNLFVKKHFGDSVFYIDTSLPLLQIYQQIQRHLEAIRQNPRLAMQMAQRAHQIFVDHFQMTDQLKRLEAMHQKLQG